MKELVLKGTFNGVWVLESFAVLEVPDELVFLVARTIATAEKVGVRIEWLDQVIGDISAWGDHLILKQKEEHRSTWLEELQEETDRVQQMLEEVL